MTLALHGGTPVRTRPFPPRPPYGIAERNVANEVVASGQLSGFVADEEGFLGGPRVQSLERAFCERFNVRYAVAMNSATSCLFGAVKAVTEPRAEVVVAPWSMSASATCVLEAGCTPVFGDIELSTYGLSSARITPRTRAIVLVHLFGCPALNTIAMRNTAQERGIALIEDVAQAPGATWLGAGMEEPQPLGTFGEVGVFSLNRHKQIQTGEGGIAITNLEEIAHFLRCYRNHGETVRFRRQGYWGGNHRMGEVEAAIGEVQLERLDELIEPRIWNAGRLTESLSELEGVEPPKPPKGLQSVHYLYPMRWRGLSAERVAVALSAEGVPASQYVEPLYRLPVLRGHARIDDTGDWGAWYPNVERAYEEVVVLPHVHAGMKDEDVDDVITAVRKVWLHREEL